MERIAIFTTDDGGEVAIQVADDGLIPVTSDADVEAQREGLTLRGIPEGALATRGIPSGRLVERAQQSLDDVLAHARPAVSALVRQVRAQEDAPDELEVEFGFQVSLEVGAYIAAAGSMANFRVTMRWLADGR
ncbi:CU044_2847 family protein [Agromyces sp. NPDC057865]|uniref:CU044_2847 family protein n=1 Tax=Agromyces sp. NPDC057865 TaxID=3346267 RepID=UPI0036720E02